MRYLGLLLLGGMVAVVAGGVYHLLGWLLRDCTDHTRGLWQGMVTVYVVTYGQELAKCVAKHWFRGTKAS
jgi:hypothetical protein